MKLATLMLVVFFLAGSAEAKDLSGANRSQVNVDLPFTQDPICGFEIIVRSAVQPQSSYTGWHNPWGNPTIVQVSGTTDLWRVTFGGPGPCFNRSESYWLTAEPPTRFKGFHFGFYTDVASFKLAGCWAFGLSADGMNFTRSNCFRLLSHQVSAEYLQLVNGTETALAATNVQVAISGREIHINDLDRDYLPDLAWQELPLENNLLPAAVEGTPGTLDLSIPDEILEQPGFVVVSYDVTDPETGELYSAVTLEFAVPSPE